MAAAQAPKGATAFPCGQAGCKTFAEIPVVRDTHGAVICLDCQQHRKP